MSDFSGNSLKPSTVPSEQHAPTSPAGLDRSKRISSAKLFAGAREVLIDHSGETYRLRRTSLGKLILTK